MARGWPLGGAFGQVSCPELSGDATFCRVSGTVGGPGPDPDHEVDRLLRGLWDQVAHEVAREKKPALRRAAALRRSPPGRRPQRSGPRRYGGVTVRGWAITIVAAVAAGTLSWWRIGGFASGADQPIPVSSSPAPASSPARPPADPFAGTPAGHFAAGQAGITIPAARPAGSFSAAQVTAAYRETRKLLIAGSLDPRTLNGGSPDAFARLLIPRQRALFTRHLDLAGLAKDGTQRSTRAWVVSFAPGTTRLIGHTIKVHGMMSARAAVASGRQVLRVRVDYLFVYAVAPPRRPGDWMRVVDRNYGTVDFAAWDDPGGPLEPWLTLWNGGGPAGGRCDVSDGFVHPAFPAGPPDKVRPSGRPFDPYSQASKPAGTGCRATTGT